MLVGIIEAATGGCAVNTKDKTSTSTIAVGRSVTVSSRRVLGVWIGVVKIDGVVRWCSTFVASRARARQVAQPIAREVRAALRGDRPIILPPISINSTSFLKRAAAIAHDDKDLPAPAREE